ncbi:MAG: hypothetical protein JW917_07550 [Ignavibacteria bacterium]|nr:hypothetical protein [Ignavibacteria bacterium]
MKVFENIKRVLENKELSYFDKSVYFALISFNGKNKCFPSLNQIGERINSSSITYISNSINKLKKMEIITVKRRKNKSNIYLLNPLFDELKPGTDKPIPPGKPKEELSKTDMMKQAEEELSKEFIYKISLIIAEYRNETKPGKQIFTFINKIINAYSDNTVKKYQVAFMLLCYILKAGANKFKSGLPFAYFNSFFPMLYYSDFRREMFNSQYNKIDNFITLKNNQG